MRPYSSLSVLCVLWAVGVVRADLATWCNEAECGLRATRQGKIINGTTAAHGDHPWLVSLLLNNRHHCGGSLIRPNWVLTAAHCVYRMNPTRFRVKLGSHRRNQTAEETAVELNVSRIIYHTGFSYATFADDLALIQLVRPVNYTNFIRPICLPLTPGGGGSSSSSSPVMTHDRATVAGWGKLKQGGASADRLQEVVLPLVENTMCQAWFRAMGKTSILVRPTQICAGLETGGKDACQGDSGSPLMVTDPLSKRSQVIGIVSAGIGCALPKLPGLYTRVTSYLDWIDQKITVAENETALNGTASTANSNSTTTTGSVSTVTSTVSSTTGVSTSSQVPPVIIAANKTIIIDVSKPIKIVNATLGLMRYFL